MALVAEGLHDRQPKKPRLTGGLQVGSVAVRAAVPRVSVVRGIVKRLLDLRILPGVRMALQARVVAQGVTQCLGVLVGPHDPSGGVPCGDRLDDQVILPSGADVAVDAFDGRLEGISLPLSPCQPRQKQVDGPQPEDAFFGSSTTLASTTLVSSASGLARRRPAVGHAALAGALLLLLDHLEFFLRHGFASSGRILSASRTSLRPPPAGTSSAFFRRNILASRRLRL